MTLIPLVTLNPKTKDPLSFRILSLQTQHVNDNKIKQIVVSNLRCYFEHIQMIFKTC